jgi:hypothetical protein
MAKRKLVGHLHYFTKETALATLTDAGFEVQDYFYTAGSLDLPQHTLLAQMARIPRRILFNLFPDTSVKVFGGFSLLVLAK